MATTKKNIIAVNGVTYEVNGEVLMSIQTILSVMGKKVSTSTTKAEVKTEKKEYAPAYSVDGKSVTLGGDKDNYVPKKVFYAIKCSLQEAGAKWNSKAKSWDFATKKDCDAWVKAQKNR